MPTMEIAIFRLITCQHQMMIALSILDRMEKYRNHIIRKMELCTQLLRKYRNDKQHCGFVFVSATKAQR